MYGRDAMVDVGTLELPEFNPDDTELNGDRFHEVITDLSRRSWLLRIPLGYMTTDRAAGEFFLRSRHAIFPGQTIAELFGIESGPLREEIDRNILHINGDDHTRLRNLLNPFFTPKAADRWRPVMRSILEEVYEGLDGDGRMEFVQDFAKPYPSLTISTIVGAPREDAARLYDWSNWIQRQFDAPSLMSQRAEIDKAVDEFYEWCHRLLAERRHSPADDLVSVLIDARYEGHRLTDEELVNLVLNVLVGAVDTTQSQLAHAIRLFALHPEQWDLLGREPERAPAAVEEVLRQEPVTPFTARILTDDLEYQGVRFPQGTVVMVCSLTGNWDGVGDASFDITADREGARLMTFGAGVHYCVGSNIARAELEEALAFLAPRLRALRLDGEPRFGTIQGIYGLDSLPIAWDR